MLTLWAGGAVACRPGTAGAGTRDMSMFPHGMLCVPVNSVKQSQTYRTDILTGKGGASVKTTIEQCSWFSVPMNSDF